MRKFIKWFLFKECEICKDKKKAKIYYWYCEDGNYAEYLCDRCKELKDENFIKAVKAVNELSIFN